MCEEEEEEEEYFYAPYDFDTFSSAASKVASSDGSEILDTEKVMKSWMTVGAKEKAQRESAFASFIKKGQVVGLAQEGHKKIIVVGEREEEEEEGEEEKEVKAEKEKEEIERFKKLYSQSPSLANATLLSLRAAKTKGIIKIPLVSSSEKEEEIARNKNSSKTNILNCILLKFVKKGQGSKSPSNDANCEVEIVYTCVSALDKKLIDSTATGKTSNFKVGGVVKGLSYALQFLCEGDQAEIYFDSSLFYGEKTPPGVPKSACAFFTVELKSVKSNAKPAGDADQMMKILIGKTREDF